MFESGKFKGLVNRLQFAPDGSWLLGAGGAGEGFLIFLDPATRKAVREEKVPMHVHDFALGEDARDHRRRAQQDRGVRTGLVIGRGDS